MPHLVVLADRAGADIIVFTRRAEATGAGGAPVQSVGEDRGDDPHLRKSSPGGWSQRRYQSRAENLWEQNARAAADQVASLADETADDVVKLAASVAAEDTVKFLRLFRQERGQNDLAVEGVPATIAALAASRVDTLLIHDDPDDARTACFGPEPGILAETPSALSGMGVDDPQEARLVDVAIKAAFATGAAVRVVPSVGSVQDGIGALLRF